MLVNLNANNPRSVRPLGTCYKGTVVLKDGEVYLVVDDGGLFKNGTCVVSLADGQSCYLSDDAEVKVIDGEFNEFVKQEV